MAAKEDLTEWVREALVDLGGKATLTNVARKMWELHEHDLRNSGDLFYTWQYDMRWSANKLRRTGVMRATETSAYGVWELV